MEGRAGSDLAPEAFEFAVNVHQYHREYISTADKKAAFVFAVSSALLVYLYQQSLHVIGYRGGRLLRCGALQVGRDGRRR